MKILGNRLLISKIEEEKKEGFQTVDVQDSFVYKGKVEQVPESQKYGGGGYIEGVGYSAPVVIPCPISVGDTVLFAKYSPDTQEIDHEGQKMKVISVADVIAVL